MRKTSGIIKLVSLAWFTVAALTACGGGAGTEGNPNTSGGSAPGSLITVSSSADVIAFEKHVWQNLSSQSRCGRCHSTDAQDPQFVHGANIETAHAAALSFINGVQVANLASPDESRMVTIIRNGHKQVDGKSQACWLATDALCADDIRDFIIAWDAETNGTEAVPKGVVLTAPSPLRDVSDSKNFPEDSTAFGTLIHEPILSEYCAECHTPNRLDGGLPQSPFFASNDINASYLAAQQKMNLLDPGSSRFVVKICNLDQTENPRLCEAHKCWSGDCEVDAQEMEDAITAYSNTITPTQVDPNLIISKAMKLQPPEAIVATGGQRHTVNQIALWEFKEGSGSPTAFDTSGVSPTIDLSVSGDVSWVGGYGLQFNNQTQAFNGRAQATFQASQKLLNNIRTRGEYSIEAWVIPANVVQQNKNIISYSGNVNERNFTIAQNEYHYQFYNRTTTSDSNGMPVLESAAEDLQASQQHIVMSYDPVNGRRMYINGALMPDVDNNDVGGLLTDWNPNHAFILANELGTSNGWQGTIRMVAIHNRVLTDQQIQQNFKVGVGEKFFLLFSISHVPGVPADSYIKVQAEQFDTYSYLFDNPVYVNLGNPVPAINFVMKGMRIGINGQEAIVGQAFINLKTDGSDLTITANDQEVSRLGSVIQLQQGTQTDDFFLSFEKLGTQTNLFVVAAPSPLAAPNDLPDQSDIGVRTFSELNATMSELTGVPTNNSAVLTKYTLLKQQLPSSEDMNAFGPANIIAISQLAFEYCDQLVEDTTLRGTFFNIVPYNFNGFGQAVSTAFSTTAKKEAVVNALYDRMIGIPSVAVGAELINAPTRTEVLDELVNLAPVGTHPGNLFTRLDNAGSNTNDIIKAMCTSVLGSAGMLIQ